MVKIIPEPVFFEWDSGNVDKNYQKHSVTNKEAEELFKNNPHFVVRDEKHSTREERFMIIGMTDSGRRLIGYFTIRDFAVRIISVRDMSKKERRGYEEKIQNYTKV